MAAAVELELAHADVLIMAKPAPADFRATAPASAKIKKEMGAYARSILSPTVDILASTRSARREGAVIVGFALETENAVVGGRAKLAAKDLDMVVVNDATEPGAGFGVDTNRVTLLTRDGGEEVLPLLSKYAVANEILDRVERLAHGR